MHKTLTTCLMMAFLAVACSNSTFAQQTGAAKSDATAAAKPAAAKPAQEKAAKGEKPKASPGWVVIEEDWWVPFRYDFTNSIQRANAHLRPHEESAAAAEIDRAIGWLKLAENDTADKATEEDLNTARMDLMDFSQALRTGKAINADNLKSAFHHATTALANHHRFKGNVALAKSDLITAGNHLRSAVDYLREAASAAQCECGPEVVAIYDEYAPFGYWTEDIVYDKNKLEANLTTVDNELKNLSAELKKK